MVRAVEYAGGDATERALRAQILAVLEELCRDMTLRDVREWYLDAMVEPGPVHAVHGSGERARAGAGIPADEGTRQCSSPGRNRR